MSEFYFVSHRAGTKVKTIHGTSTVPGSKVHGPYKSEADMMPHLERVLTSVGGGGVVKVIEVEDDAAHPEMPGLL